MARTHNVLIAGGGIGGLTAALALLQRGIDATVHERAEALGEVGAGLHISPNGARVLFALGLEDGLRRQSVRIVSGQPGPLPRLKAIMLPNAGLDGLAPFDWMPSGAVLLNNSGTHAEKAGEYVLMALLMLANRMPELIRSQAARAWNRHAGSVMRGRHVVVVGLGALGGAAADWAYRLGMRVTGVRATARPHPSCHRVVGPDTLGAVLPDADALVLACPLTAETRDLVTREMLMRLPAHAGVVNIGRGEVLDEAGLCELLEAGRLGGAVLDVCRTEPPPPDHPFWRTRNLVLTPHVSANDPAGYMPNTLAILLRNAAAIAAGAEPPNRFDIARGY